ncbi:MAG: Asp-tRNA(Asn)/Glu-tRNA(Gln) amidotransferase GatCAB subunit C [Candidatus Portnoybacteria bacterium CG06_land_8_20_14_3_00_39_12]|uniref:Aspartyl/glutamyl-tRNA(Asn/Gln) amidotransferase subunit C n=3 Tax=Candidatus Portnoyibacteriota TaxID=1817913 RepID=A0A2M8KG68_9BACT|nr:MAG: hypothetical protein AUJ33_01405 [Parcubacteria group bacterium CG1_02_40_25]PIU75370.1 MAG: Asp-tRNA(Asn)/Glu-tRNA(Gln) amidotransferase GatCAB subunit C [Candidatus Portnoybacteria bacterium CG06_land_8_20_14_3_00_39_12]PIZ71088.1 MAG: Asp-tRNA(Asn)/Glu-tRNA(Gln) amidotransferase GatCAB subunit C [Candidatus Portnoybacteria bacterium CG_4_10_14_0_2_um_filter_39_11]PJE58887.1 MAG: Asp-tRNA(Asn)/Glu-tRNA(Gln) amidotransferase GatCAB subunit C [Candidatus Portnoybacteria bacterium CG10_bi
MGNNKNQISIEEVGRVAQLARIELTSAEKEKFSRDLSAILDYVDQLDEIDVSTVAPTSQVTGLKNVLRQDVVVGFDQAQLLVRLASTSQENYIKVKSVF